ncbi:MAG TPA: bifunctional hydroxymethylpyrimidine kinase/phosphomethylpyrimidine kinase [Vicinamibacterales bacterium]|nr:bifunctional hydroxymethylpyrimidine kinase/phosphomethylpyrimidine kinase [Vicinamibacterales bacterium]
MQTALTIAGSDSGGGAGIQADLKTFAAHGVFGTSAITAITAQNTRAVTAALPLPPDLVVAQIDAVLSDLGAQAIKIGMLATSAIIEAVAAALERHGVRPIVLDTVMISKSGARLLAADAVSALARVLVPLADVITPNVPEAEALTGLRLESIDDLRRAAEVLVRQGARAALVKGGHLDGPAIDVLFDGTTWQTFEAERIVARHTHGTGCTYSAAIAANLALGRDLPSAIDAAKTYVTGAIRQAPGLGAGHGPLHHFWQR